MTSHNDTPLGVKLSAGLVQRMLVVVPEYLQNEGEVLEVADEGLVHRDTYLGIGD